VVLPLEVVFSFNEILIFSHRLRDALEFSQLQKLFHYLPHLAAAGQHDPEK